MKESKKPGLRQSLEKFLTLLPRLRPYLLIVFLVFIALIYGFLFLRINTLANSQPSDTDVASQVKAAKVPHIDLSLVKQLESLQDNSVSVKTLFQDARNNPFQ